MEASVGAGHDLVSGWHDDPHIYPDKLLEVTDICEYLGKKYGGWESVCHKYAKRNGKWIAVPMGAPGQQIVYRKSWLNEAGYDEFPKDVQGFIKLCKKLKGMGHPVGFAMGHAVGDGNNWVHTWLWSFGAKTVNPDGSVAINSAETRNALEGMKELYDEAMIRGCASWLDPHNNKAYLANQISVTNNGISIYYAAKGKFPEIAEDTYHASLPVGPVGKPTELHLFNQAFIFKHTSFPNAAKHYLTFMLEREQCAPWTNAMRGYVTPALKDYRNLPVWTEDPKHTPYRDCVKNMLWNGYEGPIGPASAAVMAEYVVVDLFANFCARGKSLNAAIDNAEKAIARYYA
jgi:multiple sugar transport system substrate-binding protein